MLACLSGGVGHRRGGDGDVPAHDAVGRGGGRAATVEKIELAAHLDLATGAQVEVAHLGNGGAGKRPSRRLGRRTVLGIKADIRRQVVYQAQASRDCIPTLVEPGLRRVIDELEVDMVIAQRSDQCQLLGVEGAFGQWVVGLLVSVVIHAQSPEPSRWAGRTVEPGESTRFGHR